MEKLLKAIIMCVPFSTVCEGIVRQHRTIPSLQLKRCSDGCAAGNHTFKRQNLLFAAGNIITTITEKKISFYERRRVLIATLYERHNDIVGNRAFEFDASFHTIRNDIRVLELKYPIYTRMGAGGGVFILDSSRLQQRWLTVHQRELLMDVCSVLDDERALLMKSIIGGLPP